jgi:hypothetical protein
MEDASDTEEEKFQCNSSDSNSSSSQLKEANINMSAREVLDSCRGKKNLKKKKNNTRALISVRMNMLINVPSRLLNRSRRFPGFAPFPHFISQHASASAGGTSRHSVDPRATLASHAERLLGE